MWKICFKNCGWFLYCLTSVVNNIRFLTTSTTNRTDDKEEKIEQFKDILYKKITYKSRHELRELLKTFVLADVVKQLGQFQYISV